MAEQLAPILGSVATIITAIGTVVGGQHLRHRSRVKELSQELEIEKRRRSVAESNAFRRLALVRRVELWAIQSNLFNDKSMPSDLRRAMERENEHS